MISIGLIAAMREEVGALLRLVPGAQACRVGAMRAHRFQVNGQDCLLVECGIGLERAEQATRVLRMENPRALISFGVAGAVQADLAIGDVVVARQACRLEQGRIAAPVPLAGLSAGAWQRAGETLRSRGARLVEGVAVTTRGAQMLLSQPAELTNPVLEMETAAIAGVAAQAGIPLLALRAISDNPAEPIPLDPSEVLDQHYRLRPLRLLLALLRRPGILARAGALRRNTRRAADNAAAVVWAVLEALL